MSLTHKLSYWHQIALLLLLCYTNPAGAAATAPPVNPPDALTLTFLPYLTAGELIKKYTPLVKYLEKHIEIPITLQVSKDYQGHTQQVGEDKLDIAFLGGIPYIKMVAKYGQKRLLARYEMHGKPTFQSVIVVANNSPLKTLSELAGQRFAFGDPNSTLSTLVPSYMLKQAGITLEQLKDYEFLKNQPNVVLGVLFGDYAAGAVALEVFDEYKARGIRALAVSPAVSTHVFVASNSLSGELVKKLQTAFYQLKESPEGQAILSAIGKEMTGFVPVQDSDYDLLRTIFKETPALPTGITAK